MNQKFRTLLVLGRVSNLPTVWSNCLAGWWLGGGGNFWKLPFLFLGVSLLYTGGMYLNDAFDEEYDRARRPERPIPAGKIPAGRVWRPGFGQLAAGVLTLVPCGNLAVAGAVLLAFFIVLYDFTHKFFTAAPWLMGACRFWVYVIASAAGVDGLNGFAVFGGVALASYVVGLSYVARRERSRGAVPVWPLLLLAAPMVLALAINADGFLAAALWISLVLGLWIVRSCPLDCDPRRDQRGLGGRQFAGGHRAGGLAGGGAAASRWLSAGVFLLLLGLAKWFQKFVPAT